MRETLQKMQEITAPEKGQFAFRMLKFYFLGEDFKEEVAKYVKQNVVSGVEEFVHDKLVGSKNAKMQIAVTGNSGAGKSSFINAIRG